MDRWLIAAIERVSPRVRGLLLGAAALLLLGTAITSPTLEASPGGGARRPTPARPSGRARSHRIAVEGIDEAGGLEHHAHSGGDRPAQTAALDRKAHGVFIAASAGPASCPRAF